jgi:hypothetical protein
MDLRRSSPLPALVAFAVAAVLLAAVPLKPFAPRPAGAIDCTVDSLPLTPVTDLGPGAYLNTIGGLYFGGSNVRPPAHTSAGLAIANAIAPLDTVGNSDPAHGRVVLISIGMSNTNFEFTRFVPLAMNDPQRNPRLLVVNCAEGGQSADIIKNPGVAYWDTVAARLRAQHSSPLQVQAVWLKEADKGPSGGWPAATDSLGWNLGTIVRLLHQKLPNVKLCYMTSRIYAGYATTTLNPEPYAYQSAFAVRSVVCAQIAGADSLNYDAGRGAVEAPWLSWGPYLWADGLKPRSDGMTWPCADFQQDGTHPDIQGSDVVADSLLAFFKSDETTAPWFVAGAVGVAGGIGERRAPSLVLAPNPALGATRVSLVAPSGSTWALTVTDAAGRFVLAVATGVGTGAPQSAGWSGVDAGGARVRPGVYWITLRTAGLRASRALVLLAR